MTNKELKTIIKMFESSSLTRLKLDKDNVSIELEKQKEVIKQTYVSEPQTTPLAQSQDAEEKAVKKSTFFEVKAPLVGTYYEAPAPDQPAFVRKGQTVKKGDTLFIIEAMKVMNEITAPKDGKIQIIHVKNGDMVMFDQVIMEID